MRNIAALALGLLFIGLGLYAAAAVTPFAYSAAFDPAGATRNVVALFVMLTITAITSAFGGWITARLVSDHRVGHALMAATLGLVAAVLMGAVRWGASRGPCSALRFSCRFFPRGYRGTGSVGRRALAADARRSVGSAVSKRRVARLEDGGQDRLDRELGGGAEVHPALVK